MFTTSQCWSWASAMCRRQYASAQKCQKQHGDSLVLRLFSLAPTNTTIPGQKHWGSSVRAVCMFHPHYFSSESSFCPNLSWMLGNLIHQGDLKKRKKTVKCPTAEKIEFIGGITAHDFCIFEFVQVSAYTVRPASYINKGRIRCCLENSDP